MTNKEKTTKNNLLLKNYIDKKELVKINRTVCGEATSLRGYILDMSRHFLLIQLDNEFMLDGYAIIKSNGLDNIRCNKYDKAQNKIFKAEGLLENYGLINKIPLANWTEIFKTLKKLNYCTIVENINNDYLDFFIGPIKGASEKTVSIHNFDPSGKLDSKPTNIKLETISIIKFGDRYSTIFKKHLK
jgi:hypothetical protein